MVFLVSKIDLLHILMYILVSNEETIVRKFDYSFLKTSISGRLMNLVGIIYDIKGKESVRLESNPELFKGLRNKAIRDSIKGSNAIENIHTTEKRIDEIAGGSNESFTHQEEEIIGYRNVLNEIHEHHSIIHFDKTTILSLHKSMLDVAKIENRGHFKKDPNIITERVNGKMVPIFVPVSPEETEEAIDQLLLAYQEAIHDPEINPLLLVPCVILDFLCIHPFDDGNGRISRLLTLLLLYKSGFDIGRFISIENVINESKGEYYRTLGECSTGWADNQNTYEPFILYMIQVIYKCYSMLDENVFASADKKLSKAERIEYVLMNALVPISKRDIIDKLPDISPRTIEVVISKLMEEGKIIKIGSYRDATYYRK